MAAGDGVTLTGAGGQRGGRRGIPASSGAGLPHPDCELRLQGSAGSVVLSPAEARILATLLRAQCRVVPRDQLALAAASQAGHGLDSHMYRLRQKLTQVRGLRLETVPKRGFRLVMTPQNEPDRHCL